MKVYVIMGNDYPDAVCASEELADAYVEKKKKESTSKRIYWRHYEFEIQEKQDA